jgi:hypothetical protein
MELEQASNHVVIVAKRNDQENVRRRGIWSFGGSERNGSVTISF